MKQNEIQLQRKSFAFNIKRFLLLIPVMNTGLSDIQKAQRLLCWLIDKTEHFTKPLKIVLPANMHLESLGITTNKLFEIVSAIIGHRGKGNQLVLEALFGNLPELIVPLKFAVKQIKGGYEIYFSYRQQMNYCNTIQLSIENLQEITNYPLTPYKTE